jgi:hypothetical protein
MNVDPFWTRPGTDVFLGPQKRTGVSGSNEQGGFQELLEISVALLILTGGMILPNNLDPDGCMVQ